MSEDKPQEASWDAWKETHGKSYETPEEESKRKEIWENTKRRVKEHNDKFAKGEVTYQMGVNQFADLESHEMSRYCGLKKNKD